MKQRLYRVDDIPKIFQFTTSHFTEERAIRSFIEVEIFAEHFAGPAHQWFSTPK